jgi:signal transduction histidine kinase
MTKIAEILESHGEEILRRFEMRVRERVGTEGATRSELRDFLPRYLRLLAQTLRESSAEQAEARAGCQNAAKEHGEQRLGLGFDPGSVVREYGYLLNCIFELCTEQGSGPSAAEARWLSDHINLTCSQAIAEYARLRDERLAQQAAQHVSFLAHELRNALNSAQIAMEILGYKSEAIRGSAGQALLRGLDRLRDLIDVPLTTTLLSAGRAALQRETLSLTELLSEAIAESDIHAQSKDIRFLLDAEEGLTVEGDRRLLRSVLSNIVRNAVKFTPRGTIAIRAQRRGGKARVEVEDSCGGLPEEKLESIFMPFVQIGRDRSGFGLGLAITQEAIKAHGGEVFVTNQPGKGCTFGFEIPLEGAVDSAKSGR